MKLLAFTSSYREGSLVQGAIRSGLAAADLVVCFDGPAGQASDRGEPSDFSPWLSRKGQTKESRLIIRTGEWASDAAKRTAMIEWARGRYQPPVWCVWIDGDEVLLWGEFLRDYIIRVMQGDAVKGGNPTASFAVKLADMDGQVWNCFAKVLRLDLVEAILESSYQVKFYGVDTVMVLPNEIGQLAPLQGEPHLLHRSMLRPPGRDKDRLHKREPGFYEEKLTELTGDAEQAREWIKAGFDVEADV